MTESTNMLLQSIAVGFIILVCIIYIVRRTTRRRRKDSASCSGCPLADSCHRTSTGKKPDACRHTSGNCSCGCH